MGLFSRIFGSKPREPGPDWAPFFDGEASRHFHALVSQDLKKRGLAFEMGDGVVLVTLGAGEPNRLGLQNLSQICHQSEQRDWPEVIARHFEAIFRSRDEGEAVDRVAGQFDQIKHLLKVRLFPEDYGDDKVRGNMVAQVPASGLSAVLCFDLPSAVRSVGREQTRAWAIPDDILFQVAVANVRAEGKLERKSLEVPGGARLQALVGESFFSATHVLFLEDYLGGMPEHGALVAVPHRHVLLFHPIADVSVVQAVNALVPMADGMFKEGPGSVSPNIYWWRKGALTHLPAEVEKDTITFKPTDEFVALLDRLAAASPKH